MSTSGLLSKFPVDPLPNHGAAAPILHVATIAHPGELSPQQIFASMLVSPHADTPPFGNGNLRGSAPTSFSVLATDQYQYHESHGSVMASALVQTSKGLGAPSNAIFLGYLLSILSFMLIAFSAYLWLSWSKSAGGMFSAFCEQVAKRWKVDENDTAEHEEDDTDGGEDVEEGQEDSQHLPLDASGANSERKRLRLVTDDREVKHKKNVAASKNATSTTASVSDAEANHSTSSSSEEEVEYEDVEEATSPDERCAKKMKKGRGSKPFYATRVMSSTSSQKHEAADKLQTNRGLLAQMKGMKVQANVQATTTTTAPAFDRKYLPFKLQNYMEESPFGP